MVFDRRQFDDFDDFSDFDQKLESFDDNSEGTSTQNDSLGWRRSLIEKAASSVRKALENRIDPQSIYEKGSLLFDEESCKFGRVVDSTPGYLNITLLRGGKLVKQDINHREFIRLNRQKLTLSELADRLTISEDEVIQHLNKIEFETEAKPTAIRSPEVKKIIVKNIKKPELKIAAPKMPKAHVALQASKSAPKVKLAAKKMPTKVIKQLPSKKESSVSFTKMLPKGATTDPIVDPNGYIQQNFLLMSNKELSLATNLSEHTIRRKLGEWGLKRKDFINKA